MSKELTIDPDFDKQAVFQLLAKFNLSAVDVAEIFTSYLTLHPPTDKDLGSFRDALKKRGTQALMEILSAVGPLLTSEEIREKLGVASRQTIHNHKKIRACCPFPSPTGKPVDSKNQREPFHRHMADGAESVAASTINPLPVTPAAPLEVSSNTASSVS